MPGVPMLDLMEERYYLKRPDSKRKTYSLVCYKLLSRTQKEYLELSDTLKADVLSINQKFKNKEITQIEAETLLTELIKTQYRKSKVQTLILKQTILSDANHKILNRFWLKKYDVKYLEDEASARNDFERSFRALEPLSIQVASQGEIQKQLKKKLVDANRIRRASERLNEVLEFLKRDFKLELPKKPRRAIKHVSKNQLFAIIQHFECSICKDLAVGLFATGARIGEAMALEETDLAGLQLRIDKQISTKGRTLKLPKREKTGDIAVLEFGLEHLKNWINVRRKWDHRWHINKELASACKKAEVKSISVHDLRHSHAIYLLTLGATLTDVSLNLRNRIEVCQEYYTGYAHSEGTLERLKRLTSDTNSEIKKD